MKLSKKEVEFEHPAQGSDHCSQCRHFNRETRENCRIVAGVVLPADWCRKFASTRARREGRVAAHMNTAASATA